ncbi:MAG: uracil-DNA glycosylase [Amaricoccus sp.]|uniref:uracil-DNA glycosylase n=1 Tax=Amaricoccus sp. TaxID=1872485 RepID=UPI003314BFD6
MSAPPESWRAALDGAELGPALAFQAGERARGRLVHPEEAALFRALELTPPEAVKVVILGQDPYHGPGQAHGLSFSVREGVPPPPSLRNIYKELEADLGISPPPHGCLEAWARRGALLLNTVLSVEDGKAGSHRGQGWESVTDAVIRAVNDGPPAVFLLWGAPAAAKARLVDRDRHLVLTAPHPSPLSAYRGFLGCRHFSQANTWLEARGRGAVDWRL